MNPVFKSGVVSPNYWCTWSNQSYAVEVPVIRENDKTSGYDGYQGGKSVWIN